MPRSPLSVISKKGLERLGLGPIAEDILKEPEYEKVEPIEAEPMTFEELALELPETDQGLRVTPEFALEQGQEIPEGEEWFLVPSEETTTGYDVEVLRDTSKYALPDWSKILPLTYAGPQKPVLTYAGEEARTSLFSYLKQEPRAEKLKLTYAPEEEREFIWDYGQGRYVEETPEGIKERLQLLVEHPELRMMGVPSDKRLTETQYDAYRDRLIDAVFPGQTEEEVGDLITKDPDAFYAHIEKIGQTKETVEFFMTFFPNATKEEVDYFFEPISYVPDKPLAEVPIGAYKISRQPLDAISDFFVKDPDGFRIAILFEGRTPETEAIVKEMFLTHERPPSKQGIIPAHVQKATQTPWDFYYGQELDESTLGVYFKDDAVSKFMRGEYLPDPLKDYAKVYLQGWGDMASGFAGFADRVGADALSRTLELEGLEGQLIARDVDWGKQGSLGYYAKQFTRMVPFIQTTIATSLVPGGLAFNAVKAAGGGTFLAKTGATIAGSVAASVTEGTIEAGMAYNEAKGRGLTQAESNAVFDKVLAGNVGLLSLTNTAQLGAAMFLPGGNTLRLITKGTVFGFASASEGLEEGGQLLISRYALGDDALVFDNEFWENLKLGMVGGLAFQSAATLFGAFKSRVSGAMDDAQRAQWQKDVAQGQLQGLSHDEAEVRAYDMFTETPEGEAIVEQEITALVAQEKAEAVKELPKALAPFSIFDSVYGQVAEETKAKAQAAAGIKPPVEGVKALPKGEAKAEAITPIAPEVAYDASLEAFRKASREFREITKSYRARQIGDEEFLKARAEFDKASEIADAAETSYINAKAIPPTKPQAVKPALSPEVQAIIDEHLPKVVAPISSVQQTIEKLPSLLPETPNAKQLQKLEQEIVNLSDQQVDGLVDLADAIDEYKSIQKKGLTPDEYREQRSDAWDNIVEAVDNLSVAEDAVEGVAVSKPPPPTVAEQQEMAAMPTKPTKTEAQADYAIDLFSKYLMSPEVGTARVVQDELWRQERGLRASRFQETYESLIAEGVAETDAFNQAKATMSGPLEIMRVEDIPVFTAEMTNTLMAKIDHFFADKPDEIYESISTKDALVNALSGKPIPREPGVKGGSAFSRLQRVFGYETTKAIDKNASQGKSLRGAVEDIQRKISQGEAPLQLDMGMLEYVRSLADVPFGQAILGETAWVAPGLKVQRTAQEIKQETEELKVELAKAPSPPTRPPIPPEANDAIKENPMFPQKSAHGLVWAAKELGLFAVDIGNFMRANMASFDLSFWRQQAPLILNNKVAFVDANVESWKAIFSQKAADASWSRITHDPLYHIYDKMNLDFLRPIEIHKGTQRWKGVEEYGYLTTERAIPRLTAKLPHVKVSARAFSTGANEHNWRIFKNHYNAMLKIQEKIASGEIKLKEGKAFSVEQEMAAMGKMLADFTGRASLGKLSPAASTLSGLMFAPRLALGRLLTPRHLIAANPHVRAEAWKNLVTFVGGVGGLIVLGAQLDLWDFEKDPRSSNFGQIRLGNTRVDPWGGYRPYVVFLSRVVTETGLSGDTGSEYPIDPLRAFTTFARGKASPLAAIMVDFTTGKTFIGEKTDIKNPKQWIEKIVPFALKDIYEAYQESPGIAAVTALPALLGAGLNTYTGDWKENFPKLGTPKYSDNLEYGVIEPIYDVKDFWADTVADFKGVDPATLTKAQGFPAYITAMAEAVEIKKILEVIPAQSLVSVNANPTKGTTIFQYRQMWLDREKLDEDGKKKFDADERTRNAQLGNMTQRQYALLVEYHGLANDTLKEAFIAAHPEIDVNQRDQWLKMHPEENAKLAIWGQANVLTKEAYDTARRLIQEFDIPDNAVDEYLPPDNIADVYFQRNDIVDEWGSNSWEDKLHRANNPELNKWLGLAGVTTPIESLELKVQYRTQLELWDAYGSKKSPDYKSGVKAVGADKSPREMARDKLLEANPGFAEARLKIQALDKGVPGELIDDYVAYYMIPSFGYDREMFLRDNPRFYEYWVEELGHSEINWESIGKSMASARQKELPYATVLRMDDLTTEEIVNILSGKPARDWWEGIMWMFGGSEMLDANARRILEQYGATAEEIQQLLALIGSTYEGQVIENLDQLVALVEQLSRKGLYIKDILAKIGIAKPTETPEYYRPETPTPTLTGAGAQYMVETGAQPPR